MSKRKLQATGTRIDAVEHFDPLTKNQERAFQAWAAGQDLVLQGSPGTGKTFLGLYFALSDVFDSASSRNRVVIFRSIVPTREIGFLPGDEKEKKEAYALPYKAILAEMTGDEGAWGKLIAQRSVEFLSTSFVRGLTIDSAVIVVDETQNLNFHELCSVITRVGMDCRVIFCGDYRQSDLVREAEKAGLSRFLNILDSMQNFTFINFGWDDILRSSLVRDFIMTMEVLSDRENETCSENSSRGSFAP